MSKGAASGETLSAFPQEKPVHMQNENGPGQTVARKEAPRAPSASYSITMRVRIDNKVGMIGEVVSAIGRAGGDVGAIDIVQATGVHVIRDITVDAASVEHGQEIVDHVGELPGVEVVNVSDRTFLLHLGGKIKSENKAPLKTRADLRWPTRLAWRASVWRSTMIPKRPIR